jgi:hypothetical protein
MKLINKLIVQKIYIRYEILPYIRLYYTKDWINKIGVKTKAITFEMAWFKWNYKLTIEK